MRKTKIFKITGLFFGGLLLVFLIFSGYTYARLRSGDLVKFKGKWYSQEEFDKIIEEKTDEKEIKSKNKCVDAYENFRRAVINDNIEKALKYIKKSERANYEIILHNKDKLEEYKKLPKAKKIKKNENISYTNIANYYYKTPDDKYVRTISFWKNFDGYWRIEYI